MQNLCDLGAGILAGPRWTDTSSYVLQMPDGTPVGQMAGISTFVELTTVSVDSAVKIDDDIPLDKACLTGCGVGTGWGSAVNAANVPHSRDAGPPGPSPLVTPVIGSGAHLPM